MWAGAAVLLDELTTSIVDHMIPVPLLLDRGRASHVQQPLF